MMRHAGRMWGGGVLAIIVLLGSGALHAQPRSLPLKIGQFQFKQDGQSFNLPILADASSLDTYVVRGKETRLVGLVYLHRAGPGRSQEVRMALMGINAPGKYGKDVIQNFVVQVALEGWSFNRAQHNCTFVFSKVDQKGVEGTVACSGTGGGTVSWSNAKFTAAP